MTASFRRLVPALLAVLSAPQASAWAQNKAACLQAYEDTQVKRREGGWLASRSAALVCSAPSCPRTLVKDCTQWAQELQSSIPTILFDLRFGQGASPPQAVVFLDGAVQPILIDGKAMPFDPGDHVAVFKAPGFVDLTRRFVALDGDKSKRIVVELRNEKPTALAPNNSAAPVPLSAKISGTVAVVAFAGASLLGWQGLQIKRDLDDRGCKPSCDSGRIADMKRYFLFADIALGTGLLASAITAYFWWSVPQEHSGPTASVSLGPQGVLLQGRF